MPTNSSEQIVDINILWKRQVSNDSIKPSYNEKKKIENNDFVIAINLANFFPRFYSSDYLE